MSSFAIHSRPGSSLRPAAPRRPHRRPRQPPVGWPALESLEDRRLLSTYTVTDGDDLPGGPTDVTLPYAIAQAISAGGSSTIDFSSAVAEHLDNTITLTQDDTTEANV